MTPRSLQEDRAAAVRERIIEGVAALLAAGDELTFAKVAEAARVSERTAYRYFPTRDALLTAVFEWANRRIGFDGEMPADGDGMMQLVRRAFPAFDEIAPVVRELLVAPGGLQARLSANDRRRRAASSVVRREAPGLGPTATRRIAAAIQVLTAAATWQVLREYWDMDGREAAETSALALELLLEAARARSEASG